MCTLELTAQTTQIKSIVEHLEKDGIASAKNVYTFYRHNSGLFKPEEEAVLLTHLILNKQPLSTITTLFEDCDIASYNTKVATIPIDYQEAQISFYYARDISQHTEQLSDADRIEISLCYHEALFELTVLGSILYVYASRT